MRYDSEHKQRTHAMVVKEAAKAIRLQGPDKIGVASLMAQVGLTHGGFYAHFKSKDDLVGEAVSLMFQEREEVFQDCLREVPASEGLKTFIDRYLSKKHLEQRDIGCPVASLAADLPRLALPIRKRFDAGVKRANEQFAAVFAEIGYADSQDLARSVQAEMVGALATARTVTDAAYGLQILESCRKQIHSRLQFS